MKQSSSEFGTTAEATVNAKDNANINAEAPLVVALVGPTASGKTALALELAEHFQLEILNIDSRQLYREMDIGTAKPTAEQQRRVTHHLLDLRSPDQPITLQEFQQEAAAAVSQVLKDRGVAFLAGGSGLYLKALTQGLQPPAVPPQAELRRQLSSLGQENCHQLLQQADPQAAAKIAPADAVRTQRALEVLYASGKPMSEQQSSNPPPWRVLELGLDPVELRSRIAQRTQQIYQEGLIEETKQLSQRYGPDLPMLKTIGYGEALEVLQGGLSEAQAIATTTRRTQQFSKRQRTWFRRQHNPHWLTGQDALSEAMSLIEAGLG
jgi:tRNA dimethylallyltransferase